MISGAFYGVSGGFRCYQDHSSFWGDSKGFKRVSGSLRGFQRKFRENSLGLRGCHRVLQKISGCFRGFNKGFGGVHKTFISLMEHVHYKGQEQGLSNEFVGEFQGGYELYGFMVFLRNFQFSV